MFHGNHNSRLFLFVKLLIHKVVDPVTLALIKCFATDELVITVMIAKMFAFIFIFVSLQFFSRCEGRTNHCPRNMVEVPCKPGTGKRVYNTGQGRTWDPRFEITFNNNDGFDCMPCCSISGTSLIHCPTLRSVATRENGNQFAASTDQVESLVNDTQSLSNRVEASSNHCQRSKVNIRCREGRGRRVYNTGSPSIWDPQYEKEILVDDGWRCQPCCQDKQTSLQHCSELDGESGWTTSQSKDLSESIKDTNPGGWDEEITG